VLQAVGGRITAEQTQQLDAVMNYLSVVMLHAPFQQGLASTPPWTTEFDVDAWMADKYQKPLGEYALSASQSFPTYIPQDRADLIRVKIKTFGEHPSGLGKFTRTMFARDMRRSIARNQAAPSSTCKEPIPDSETTGVGPANPSVAPNR
jgi:hypothetical protein